MRRLVRYVLLRRVAAVAPPPPPVYTPSLDYSDARNSQYFFFPGWL